MRRSTEDYEESKMKEVCFWQTIVTPHVYGLAASLAKQGLSVVFIAARRMPESRRQQGWISIEGGPAAIELADTEDAIGYLVARSRPDSIHIVQGLRGRVFIRSVQKQLKSRGFKYWVLMEMVEERGLLGNLKRGLYRYEWFRQKRDVAGVLAIGEKTPAWLVKRGLPATIIYPFAYFLPVEISLPRDEIADAKHFRFIFVGQMIPRKRVDLLLAAFSTLGDLEAELVLVGGGPAEPTLKRQAEELALKGVFWQGHLPMPDVHSMLSQADCLILPSEHDGWGAVVSESLLAGTPAICSDSCGSAVVVRASGVGGVFAAGEENELALLMRRCVKDGRISPNKRAHIASWAHALSADAGAEYFVEILCHASNGGKRPRPPWLKS